MMKFIAAALMLAVATAPALAKSKGKKARVASEPRATWQAPSANWRGATAHRPRSANPQWDVYRDNGEYAGTDPDPHVRAMLRRDDPNADP